MVDIFLSVLFTSKYILCLSARLSVCLYPINVKSVELIVHKFCVGPRPQGRFMNARITKDCLHKFLIFIKFGKSTKMIKSAKKFIFVLSKRKCWKIDWATNKVEIEDRSTFRINYCNIKAVQFLLRCSNMFLSSLQ